MLILSDKYRLTEDKYNIILEVKREGGALHRGVVTKPRWVASRFFSRTNKGRTEVYHKLINLGISELEEQSLENILDVVNQTSAQILDWLAVNPQGGGCTRN